MAIAQISQAGFGNLGITASRGIPSFETDGDSRWSAEVNFAAHSRPGTIQILDPARSREWDEIASSHPQNSVFHSSAWASVLIDTYGHKPFFLHLSEDGRTRALLPLMEVASPLTGRRGVSLPFSDFCGALTFDHTANRVLADRLRDLCVEKGWRHVEVRGGDFLTTSTLKPAFLAHTLDLTVGVGQLREGVDSAVRRNLRKAQRSAVRVAISRGSDALNRFYSLHVRTRRRHGLPPQSKRFFANIYQHLLEPGLGFVALASRNAETIAAAVFLHTGKKAVYKFGASDERQQQYRAANLVMWEGIKCLTERGMEVLHFGRTALENHGLRRFKLAWGSKEESVTYQRFEAATGGWTSSLPSAGGVHNRLFEKLPLAVNRLVGTLCYPHLD